MLQILSVELTTEQKIETYIICPPMVDLPASKSNNIINNMQSISVKNIFKNQPLDTNTTKDMV